MGYSIAWRAHRTRRQVRMQVAAVIVAIVAARQGVVVASTGPLPSTGSGSSQSLVPWSWDLVGPLLIVAVLLAILGLLFRRGGH